MVAKSVVCTVIFGVSLAVVSACSESRSEPRTPYQDIMETHSLSLIEAKAFKTCQSQMRRADFKPRDGVRMTRVPAEICACHAPMMVKHFKPGSGAEHALVLAYVAGASTDTSLNANSLIDPKQPAKQFSALARSLNSCAETTARSNTKMTHDKIQELCEEGKFGAKKCEQILAKLK